MADEKTLKIPRPILAEMTKGNPQAIKALEKLQLSVFDLLPKDIQQIIEAAAADAQQAAMIANQVRDSLAPFLQSVAVPIDQQHYLQVVGISCDCNQTLQAV